MFKTTLSLFDNSYINKPINFKKTFMKNYNYIKALGTMFLLLSFMLVSVVSNAQLEHNQNSTERSSKATESSKSPILDMSDEEAKFQNSQQIHKPLNKNNNSIKFLATSPDSRINQTPRVISNGKILPEMMTEEEILVEVNNAIIATGASGPEDMKVCMDLLLRKFSGIADKSLMSFLVKSELSKK